MSTSNSQPECDPPPNSLLPPPINPKTRYQPASTSSHRPELDKAAFRLTMTEDDFHNMDDTQLTPASDSTSSPPRSPGTKFGLFHRPSDAESLGRMSFFGLPKRKQSKPSVLSVEQVAASAGPVPASTLRPHPVNYDAALRVSVGSPLTAERLLERVDNSKQLPDVPPGVPRESEESHYSAIEYSQEFAVQTADLSEDEVYHSPSIAGKSSHSNLSDMPVRHRPVAHAMPLEITEDQPLLKLKRSNLSHSKIDLMRLRPTHWCFVSRNFTQNDAASFLPWAIPATGMMTMETIYGSSTEHPFTLGMLEDLKKANMHVPLFAHTLVLDAPMMARIHQDLKTSQNNHILKMEYAKYLLDVTRDTIPPLPVESETPNAPRPSTVVQEATHELIMMKEKLQHEAGYWVEYLCRKDVPEACYLKGMCYINGFMNKEKDYERAIRWFRKAARGEYPLAFARVAEHYEARKDYTKAVTFYKKGSHLNDPYANYRLGRAFLFHELGFIKSVPYAIKFLSRSAELATSACTEGAFLLAQLHGELHPTVHIGKEHVNVSIALQLLMLAAGLGNRDAQRTLGQCYEEGLLGCSRDPFLSIAWYCRAADAGDAQSALKISSFYLHGYNHVFPPDEVYAFLWCAQAVALDDAAALYTFGEYHERGVGLRRFGGSDAADTKTARFWYMKASLHGNEDAKRKLKGTERKRMSFGLFHTRRKSADASVMSVEKDGEKKRRSKSLIRI